MRGILSRRIAATIAALVLLQTAGFAENGVKQAVKLFSAGDIAGAITQLEGIVQQEPDNLAARFWLARCAIETGDLAGAAEELQK
ncbi:MAG: tetratricopeptide repeat protein, partial [Armatimonadetes bacterium]|nr:tetratricopeptide repeat protein [Armatimonadota bacterium]